MKTILFFFLGVFITLLQIYYVSSSPTIYLIQRGNLIYKKYSNTVRGCDFDGDSCSPLTGVWGYETYGRKMAIVGAANAVDYVDVTSIDKPVKLASVKGCITTKRSITAFNDTAYVVHANSPLCGCDLGQNCDLRMRAYANSTTKKISIYGINGALPLPTKAFKNTLGVYPTIPGETTACVTMTQDFTGNIAIVDDGGCSVGDKIKNTQAANASAMILISKNQDIFPLDISTKTKGLNIPAVAIMHDDGNWLKTFTSVVYISLGNDSSYYYSSNRYRPPSGLMILSLRSRNMTLSSNTTTWFEYAQSVTVDPVRPLLYVSGYSSRNSTAPQGGILVFNITSLGHPKPLGTFSSSFIQDVAIVNKPGYGYLLFAVSLTTSEIIILNVTSPARTLETQVLSRFNTIDIPKKVVVTDDARYAYVLYATPGAEISVYNISDIYSPLKVGNITGPDSRAPYTGALNEYLLWTTWGHDGIAAYDTYQRHSKPRELARVVISTNSSSSAAMGIYPTKYDHTVAYATDTSSGFWVVELRGYREPGPSWTFWIVLTIVALGVPIAIGAAIVYIRKRQGANYSKQQDENL